MTQVCKAMMMIKSELNRITSYSELLEVCLYVVYGTKVDLVQHDT